MAEATPETHKSNGEAAERIPVCDPRTGEIVGEVPVMLEAELAAMEKKARRAFETWSQWPYAERAELMFRFMEICLDRLDEGLDVIISETGKTRTDALSDFLSAFNTIHYYAKKGEGFIAPDRRTPHLAKNKSIYVAYEPMGVAGIISPWNFPFELAVSEAVPALLAGCTVILKPSEVTPLICLWAGELFAEAGLPEGVLQVATGDGRTGAALIEHVDRISFTGSTRTGRKVAVAAAQRLIPMTLELGGNDPMIICEDADLDRAVNGAIFGGFFNAGQMCTSIERIYVQEAVYEPFLEKLVESTAKLRIEQKGGKPGDIGSLTFPPQIDIVETHVQDATANGARLLAGGKRRPDIGELTYEPTVLADMNHDMLFMKEETFGPVVGVMKVRSDEEAIQLANDSQYGLNSSVWSRDVERANRIARRVVAGTTEINDTAFCHMAIESPFGGVKDSGVGRRRGPEGIRKFCNPHTVTRDLLATRTEVFWYPNSAKTQKLIRRMMNVLWRRSWTGKLLGR